MTTGSPLIVYCPAVDPGGAPRSGEADYSYAFVLERFRPVLESLADVTEVHDAEGLAHALRSSPSAPVLSVAPVHQAPVDCGSPVVPIFAWEFDSLPQVRGAEEDIDWTATLERCAAAVTLSTHTAEVVRTACPRTDVRAIPAPLADRFERSPTRDRTITISGSVIDTALPADRWVPLAQRWDPQPIHLDFRDSSPDTGRLVGFHRPEEWGTWSAGRRVGVVLPSEVDGRVRIRLTAAGLGANAGRRVIVALGDAEGHATLPAASSPVEVDLDIRSPGRLLSLVGHEPVESPTAHDWRRLGVGLTDLTIHPRRRILRPGSRAVRGRRRNAPPSGPQTLSVDGVVYTSLFNPADGRKNWIAMLTAFIEAFREQPEATLILKMTHHSSSSFIGQLLTTLHASTPFECRVVCLHGHMTDAEIRALASATDFYVNMSTGEGLCMPLVEFMGMGVPAVAPRHTAMADYLDDSNSFPVRWSRYPTCWPQDPSRRWRTHQYRVHWDSAVEALRLSHAVAADPARYAAMSAAARETISAFCSDQRVGHDLGALLDDLVGR